MSKIIVATPGAGLTVPDEIVQAAGLTGESVEMEIREGSILLHRPMSTDEAQARDEALKRIFARSKTVSLGGAIHPRSHK